MGAFKAEALFGYIAVTGVVLGAAYMLWMFKKIFYGEESSLVSDKKHPLTDLSMREVTVLVPFVILIFWMGLFPNHFLNFSKASLENYVENRMNYNLSVNDDSSSLKVARE